MNGMSLHQNGTKDIPIWMKVFFQCVEKIDEKKNEKKKCIFAKIGTYDYVYINIVFFHYFLQKTFLFFNLFCKNTCFFAKKESIFSLSKKK